MQEDTITSVLFEVWFILRSFPSRFPALRQFYEMTVGSLSLDQTKEFVGFIEHQKVCFPLIACLLL